MKGDLDIRSCGAACRAREDGDASLHVTLQGVLDLASVPELERVLNSELGPDYRLIRVDLEQVEFIDSVGIRLMMGLYRRKHPEGEMRVVRPSRRTAFHALELVGLGKLVRFDPNADGDAATSG